MQPLTVIIISVWIPCVAEIRISSAGIDLQFTGACHVRIVTSHTDSHGVSHRTAQAHAAGAVGFVVLAYVRYR
jgi:hypothetical protein